MNERGIISLQNTFLIYAIIFSQFNITVQKNPDFIQFSSPLNVQTSTTNDAYFTHWDMYETHSRSLLLQRKQPLKHAVPLSQGIRKSRAFNRVPVSKRWSIGCRAIPGGRRISPLGVSRRNRPIILAFEFRSPARISAIETGTRIEETGTAKGVSVGGKEETIVRAGRVDRTYRKGETWRGIWIGHNVALVYIAERIRADRAGNKVSQLLDTIDTSDITKF